MISPFIHKATGNVQYARWLEQLEVPVDFEADELAGLKIFASPTEGVNLDGV